MRILQLCNKMPYPAKDGYAIAALNLAKAFARNGHEVITLAMNTTRHPVDENTIPAELKKTIGLQTVKVDNRLSAPAAFVKLLQNKSYHVSRFISKAFDEKLKSLLQEYQPDLVQLEGLYLTPYIETMRNNSKAKIVLRAHNAEHLVWMRNSEQEKNFAKKVYLKILAKQLKAYETAVLNQCDMLVPVSEVDKKIFENMGNRGPAHVYPITFDEKILEHAGRQVMPGSVFFIGSLDWLPNSEGLHWFLERVWKNFPEKFPQLKFYMAGRHMPASLKNIKMKNVIVAGEVNDAYDFISDKQVMVVPLFAGSGMRVKIIEGMALGKTIISTRVGAEGIDCTDGKNILLAENEKEFMDKLVFCAEQPGEAARIGRDAAAFALQHYSSGQAAAQLIEFYKQHLQ